MCLWKRGVVGLAGLKVIYQAIMIALYSLVVCRVLSAKPTLSRSWFIKGKITHAVSALFVDLGHLLHLLMQKVHEFRLKPFFPTL